MTARGLIDKPKRQEFASETSRALELLADAVNVRATGQACGFNTDLIFG